MRIAQFCGRRKNKFGLTVAILANLQCIFGALLPRPKHGSSERTRVSYSCETRRGRRGQGRETAEGKRGTVSKQCQSVSSGCFNEAGDPKTLIGLCMAIELRLQHRQDTDNACLDTNRLPDDVDLSTLPCGVVDNAGDIESKPHRTLAQKATLA